METVIITPQNCNADFLVTITQHDQHISISAPMPDTFNMDFSAEYEAPFAQALGANIPGAKLAKYGGYTLQSQVMTAQVWQGSSSTELNVMIEFHAENDPIAEVHNPIMELCKLVSPTVSDTGVFLTAPGPRIDWTKIPAAAQQILTGTTDVIAALAASNATPGQTNDTDSQASTPTTQPNSQSTQDSTSDKKAANVALQALKSAVKNQISITIGNYLHYDSVVITNVQLTFSSTIDDATGLPVHAKADIRFKPFFMLTADDLTNMFLTKRLRQTANLGVNRG